MLKHEKNIEPHRKQTQSELSRISDDAGEIIRYKRIKEELGQGQNPTRKILKFPRESLCGVKSRVGCVTSRILCIDQPVVDFLR